MTSGILLRNVLASDLPIFFEHQQDPIAVEMAAFTAEDPGDRKAFDAHWSRILADDTIVAQTIVYGGQVAGHVVRFERFGEPEVTYWLGREYWGQGLATRALAAFLANHPERPIYARAARDNGASIRVLEKCGFTITGYEVAYANARGQEIEEAVLELRG